jgi:non-specific serine/threonine protein kinase
MDFKKKLPRLDAPADVVQRGHEHFRRGRVSITASGASLIAGRVGASQHYTAQITCKDEDVLETSCTCSAEGICEHVVGLYFAARAQIAPAEQAKRPEALTWSKLAKSLTPPTPEPPEGLARLCYGLVLRSASWSLAPMKMAFRRDGRTGNFAPVQSVDVFRGSLRYESDDVLITSYLLHGLPVQLGLSRSPVQGFSARRFDYGVVPGRLFDLLRGREIYLVDEMSHALNGLIAVSADEGRFRFSLVPSEKGYQPRLEVLWRAEVLPMDAVTYHLTREPFWFLRGRTLIRITNPLPSGLLRQMLEGLTLPSVTQDYFPTFLHEILPPLSRYCQISFPPELPLKGHENLTARRVYVEEDAGELHVRLRAAYGDIEVVPEEEPEDVEFHHVGSEVVTVRRDAVAEREMLVLFQDTLSAEDSLDAEVVLPREAALDWLIDGLPQLGEADFEIFGRDRLEQMQVSCDRPSLSLNISSGIDWFEVTPQVRFGDTPIQFEDVHRAVTSGQRFVQLPDGSQGRLPGEWLESLRAALVVSPDSKGTFKIANYQLLLFEGLFNQAEEIESDESFLQLREKLRSFDSIEEIPLPKSFVGELRPYQVHGYYWLNFLREFRVGGCLADDMGLGKTVQTIALLARERERGVKRPSLVIVPTSVVFNWQRECQRFAPELKVFVHMGPDRVREPSGFEEHDLVISTYGILRRDATLLGKQLFHYIILDESQFIKNPQAQTARIARTLQAEHRLALTGTPIENHTSELWSQFTFLNPGLLGTLPSFKRLFSVPIEKDRDAAAAGRLKQVVKPFILRRTKEDVAGDLPDKTETIITCTMSSAQEAMYRRWRDHYREIVLEGLEKGGLKHVRMQILEGLLRLRQICCHPALVSPEEAANSGKLETFRELLGEILAGDHKVLVYSQFVQMLQILRAELDRRNIPYVYLDGRTRNRAARVDTFQDDPSIPVFLLSLKAGGTGLNLTAADYVIHYDPWWNPAVEQQATDRTHRIGQTRPVFTYKIITRDSVEEKVVDLQERKKDLFSRLIKTEKSLMKELTKEDVEKLFS